MSHDPQPGDWAAKPKEERERLRKRFDELRRQKDSDPYLRERVAEIYYAAWVRTAILYRDVATAAETEEAALLGDQIALGGQATDRLEDRLLILTRSVQARADESKANAQNDSERAAKIAAAHRQWLKRMVALRSALDECGLYEARRSVDGDHGFVMLCTADSEDLTSRIPRLRRALRTRLGPDDRLKLGLATHYEEPI